MFECSRVKLENVQILKDDTHSCVVWSSVDWLMARKLQNLTL